MATQLTDTLKVNGSYVDSLMSVDTFADLLNLNTNERFNGLTVTVKKYINNTPADFWLCGGKTASYWKLKNINPQPTIESYSAVSSNYLTKGFEVATQDGHRYIFVGSAATNIDRWVKVIDEKEIVNQIQDVLNKGILSGASEGYRTFKDIEGYIKELSGRTPGSVTSISGDNKTIAITDNVVSLKLKDNTNNAIKVDENNEGIYIPILIEDDDFLS